MISNSHRNHDAFCHCIPMCSPNYISCLDMTSGCLGCYYSLNSKTSYRQISHSLEAARLGVLMIVMRWHLTESNFRVIEKVSPRILRLRDFARSCGKTTVRLVNRVPGYFLMLCKIRSEYLYTLQRCVYQFLPHSVPEYRFSYFNYVVIFHRH